MEAVFLKHPKIEKVILYGSRAKGNYHNGSDIDLTLLGDKLDLQCLYAIDEELDALDLPYTIDLSLYEQISNEGLIEHIERRGEVFYKKIKSKKTTVIGKVVRLNDLFRIGSSKRVLKAQWKNKGIPFYRGREITCMSKYGSVDNELFISEELYTEYSQKYGVPQRGDIVITAIGTIGNSYIVKDQDRFYFKDASVLWLKKISDVSSEYINFWFKSSLMRDQIEVGKGATVDTLTIRKLQSLVVNLPSVNEQKRIVTILDQAFADIEKARANAEQNLKNARELFESYLQQVFSQRGDGWTDISLGDMLNIKHGFAFKSEFFVDMSNYVLLTPGNFYEEGGYRDRGEKQKHYKGDVPNDYILSKGDLLVAMTEQAKGLLGSPALIPEDNQFLHNQRLGLVQLEREYIKSVNLEFLYYLFNTKYFRSKVQETATGLKVRHTSPKKLMAIDVSIPTDIKVQKTIVSKLDKIKNNSVELEDIYREKIVYLDELKKSILQKAFTGELTKESSL